MGRYAATYFPHDGQADGCSVRLHVTQRSTCRPEANHRIALAVIKPATEFDRHARHNSIAHRNLNVAPGVTPLTLGSWNDLRGALKAIDDLLHAIEHHFLKTNPTNYDFLDNVGGVDSLLDIVDRGLKSRDAQFGYFRSCHPPDVS